LIARLIAASLANLRFDPDAVHQVFDGGAPKQVLSRRVPQLLKSLSTFDGDGSPGTPTTMWK
jgi:hypothetical protein